MKRKTFLIPAFLTSALTLAACGSAVATPSTLPDKSPTTTNSATRDLVVTPAVRKSLLDAAAKYHQLPPSDYVRLAVGTAYYAYDPATKRYYAGAGLVPSPKSLQAQIGTQDDGGYNLFTRSSNTRVWTVFNDGLGGAQDSTCPLSLPASVLAAWHWKVGGCYPPQ
jgi:hypothetical protein